MDPKFSDWNLLTPLPLRPSEQSRQSTAEASESSLEHDLQQRIHELSLTDAQNPSQQLLVDEEAYAYDIEYDAYYGDTEAEADDFRIHTTEDGVYFYGAPGTDFAAAGVSSTLHQQRNTGGRAMNWAAAVGRQQDSEPAGAAAPVLADSYASRGLNSAGYNGGSSGSHNGAGPVCKYFLQGNCRYGSYCRYSHELAQTKDEEEELKVKEEIDASRSLECLICYENILERGQRFGLLTGCAHPFCLDCIRNWRGNIDQPKESVRMCPVCRLPSYFIIPSYRMVSEPERKEKVIEEFKSNTSRIPCKHFNQGRGTCPFGSSCFFAHIYPDGTREETHFRGAVNAEGKFGVVPQVRLANFIS